MKWELGIARCGLACCLCSEKEYFHCYSWLDCLERNEKMVLYIIDRAFWVIMMRLKM